MAWPPNNSSARSDIATVTWVTMERDPRDIVLGAGDGFVVPRNGVTLVEATGRTTVRVRAPHFAPSGDGPVANVVLVLAGAPPRSIRKWAAAAMGLVRRAYRSAIGRRPLAPGM